MENDTIKGRLLVVEHQNKEIKEAVKQILEKLDSLDDTRTNAPYAVTLFYTKA